MPLPILSVRIVVNVSGPHVCNEFRMLGRTIVCCRLFVAEYMSGPHVFCDLGVHDSSEKGIDGSRRSVEFSCGVY